MAKKINAEGTKKGLQTLLVPVGQILFESGDNSRRYTADDISSLAKSIQSVGQLQPVGVSRTEDGSLKLEWGYRRYRAVQALNEALVEGEDPILLNCILQNDGDPVSEAEAFRRNIAENAARKDYSPIDQAHAIARLCDEFGFTIRDAGAEFGRSGAWASSIRRLLELPAGVQKKVDAGSIPVSACYDVLTMPEGSERDTAMNALESNESISRSGVMEKVRKAKEAGDEAAVAAGTEAVDAGKAPKKGDKKKRTLKELALIFEGIRDKYTSETDGKEELLPPALVMDEVVRLMGGGSDKRFERKLVEILQG